MNLHPSQNWTILWLADTFNGMNSLSYDIRRSRRRKRTLSITILPSREIVVSVPFYVSQKEVRQFVESKRDWIEKGLRTIAQRPQKIPARKLTPLEVQNYKIQAGQVFFERMRYYSNQYGFYPTDFFVDDSKSRWGVCKQASRIGINWRLIFASQEIIDYVIVHELCHLRELNHSPRFWQEVEKIIPEHRRIREELRYRNFRGEFDIEITSHCYHSHTL